MKFWRVVEINPGKPSAAYSSIVYKDKNEAEDHLKFKQDRNPKKSFALLETEEEA